MRPPAQRQSALRTPLNDLLGTEGSVRLLREFARASAPLTAGELAERVLLDRSTTRRALLPLLDTGVVEGRGTGRTAGYALRATHPLTPAVAALFAAERVRFETLLEDLRGAVTALTPPPMGAWVEGPAADGTDLPGQPVTLVIVDAGRALAERRDHLQAVLTSVEQAADVTIDVLGMTPADIAGLAEDAFAARYGEVEKDAGGSTPRVLLLVGLPPAAFLPRTAAAAVRRPAIRSHADHDVRGQALGAAIAERLRKDPTLVLRAMEYLQHRMHTASSREHQALAEWVTVLQTMSPARLRHFLRDPGQRATRLRQSMPFVGILSAEERRELDAEIARQLEEKAGDAPRGDQGAA